MSLDRPVPTTRRAARAARRAAEARPEPVLDAAKFAGTVTGIVGLVGALTTTFGWTTETQVSAIAQTAGPLVLATSAAIGAVLPVIRALRARDLVTPTADPRAADGTPLVPATGSQG